MPHCAWDARTLRAVFPFERFLFRVQNIEYKNASTRTHLTRRFLLFGRPRPAHYWRCCCFCFLSTHTYSLVMRLALKLIINNNSRNFDVHVWRVTCVACFPGRIQFKRWGENMCAEENWRCQPAYYRIRDRNVRYSSELPLLRWEQIEIYSFHHTGAWTSVWR